MSVEEDAAIEDAAGAAPVEPDPADVATVPDPALRSALEFAIAIAAAGQKLRPPLLYPPGFKPLLKLTRLDRAALRAARRAVVGDPGFRQRIGDVAAEGQVDELGVVWLQRPAGWERRVATLFDESKEAAAHASAEAAIRKAERRREAAEQAAARAHAELIGQAETLAREQVRRERAEQSAAVSRAEIASMEAETARLRREVATLRSQAAAATGRAGVAEAAVTDLTQKLAETERMRDDALAERVADAPIAETSGQASRALQNAAAATRELANALAAAGEALRAPGTKLESRSKAARDRQARRKPIPIPGGVYGDSVAATTHLLRTPGARVIVDGYNVAKLAWPNLEVADQRECCIAMLEDLVRRFGVEIHVVFDGADVVGSTAAGRRLVRVQYSPAGIIADDVIRAEVSGLPASIPVIVVTNDQAIVNDVRTEGANVVASDSLLASAGRPPVR